MQYIIMGLFIAVLSLIASNVYFIEKNHSLQLEIHIKDNTITAQDKILESQTNAIEALALGTEAYVCDLETMETYTKSKYDKIMHEHEQDSCEAKLDALNKALEIFADEK